MCFLAGCSSTNEDRGASETKDNTMDSSKIRLLTLDPGHFHAYLVQKAPLEQLDTNVFVYAPAGDEVEEHLKKIQQFNNRIENPTRWNQIVYRGPDYQERMLAERQGNVVMLAGNNAKKTRYIYDAIAAGINVLADKPMVIKPEDYPLLEQALVMAEQKGLLLYDIMTERFEITTILQKELSQDFEVFGKLQKGTPDNPGISKESVHHFYKQVAGDPLKRPAWFFDITQEGAGIVDVSTHLVDLIFWECFPEQPIHQHEVEVINARQWTTALLPEQFQKATGLTNYPDYLHKYLDADSNLNVAANGEFVFTTKGVYGKVAVVWNFEAPNGGKDTHYSIMRGSISNLIIKQNKEQHYIPSLFVEPQPGVNKLKFSEKLAGAIQRLNEKYPGLVIKPTTAGWEIAIPDALRLGHEAHFKQVTEEYLRYLEEGKLPNWETTNILTKYYITMEAYKKSIISDTNNQ